MSQYQSNIRAIDGGIAKFVAAKNESIERGMYLLLDSALDYLHDAHEDWMAHENESNTLGWALMHDGRIIEAVSQAKGPYTPRGDALTKLRGIMAKAPKTAWIGVVLSDMENNWYRIDWETNFLHFSANEVRSNFQNFFTPIK